MTEEKSLKTSDIIKENKELKQQLIQKSKINEMFILYQKALLNEIEAMRQRFKVFNDINSEQSIADSEQNRTHSEQTLTHSEQNLTNSEQTLINSEQTLINSGQSLTNSEQIQINKEINQNIKLIEAKNEIIKIKIEELLSYINLKSNNSGLLVLNNFTKNKTYQQLFTEKFEKMFISKYDYNKKYTLKLIERLSHFLMLLYNTDGINYTELRRDMNVSGDTISRYYTILNKLGFVKFQKGKKSCIYYLTENGRNELSIIKYEIENS